MFSLIWYFGLISFVVSAHSNNDTLHGGYKLNISTTMSTLPSTTIPVAKDCVLEMKESEISEIVERFNSDRVNVVDIHVLFAKTSHDKEISDFRVKLLNPIGREILYSLERVFFRLFTWTLNAGIRTSKLHVNESQKGCIKRQKNVINFAFENMQNIVRSVNLVTNYEVWYSFKETSSGKVHEICCQITKHNLPKCNHECSTGNSFLYASCVPWIVISIIMNFFALFYFMWLLHVFLSRTEFDLDYPKYYKLEESRMSPSFILFKIIIEENGPTVSFIRSCPSVGVMLYFTYLFWRGDMILLAFLLFGSCLILLNLFYGSKIINSSIKEERHSSIAPDINKTRPVLESREFAGVINNLTLPFNIFYWGRMIKICNIYYAAVIENVRMKLRNRILKILTLCACTVLAVLIYALFFFVAFLCRIILAICYPLMCMLRMVYLILASKLRFGITNTFFDLCRAVILAFFYLMIPIFLVYTFFIMTLVIQSFLLGLFLNLIYFIPYFAFFSVLTFYCGNFWKTMEEKYLVLKRLIYEACRDIEHVNNGCIPNRHPKREEKVLPVVCKGLYDKIRGKLLPYDRNLLYFALKTFWAFAFAFGILKLIDMLHEFNVTGLVQVITTASLGVMPHIFNMIALKTSEEKKKATEEKLKINVKYMVEDLLRKNPELARTVLIIQQNNDTIPDENVPDSENVQVSESDLNATDNDDAEGSELTGVLIPRESNDTTADENVHDSEKTEGLLKLLARAIFNNDATTDENIEDSEHPCDDNEVEDPELKRHLQEFYATTADENVQDSDHPFVYDDIEDPELTRLLQKVYGTTADENVLDSEHPSDYDDDCLDPELRRRLKSLREVHDRTADEIVHDTEHIEARSQGVNPPDNDNVEDPELARTALIIKGINDTAADENDQHSENVQGTSDLNPPDRDDVEELVHAEENNDTTADENIKDSERAQAGSDLNPQNLRDNREENVQDYELDEIRCDNDDENARVNKNIQYESSV